MSPKGTNNYLVFIGLVCGERGHEGSMRQRGPKGPKDVKESQKKTILSLYICELMIKIERLCSLLLHSEHNTV